MEGVNIVERAGDGRRTAPVACIFLGIWAAAIPGLAQDAGNAACSSCHDVEKKLQKSGHSAVSLPNLPYKARELPSPGRNP